MPQTNLDNLLTILRWQEPTAAQLPVPGAANPAPTSSTAAQSAPASSTAAQSAPSTAEHAPALSAAPAPTSSPATQPAAGPAPAFTAAEWQTLLGQARSHHVAPLLEWRLRQRNLTPPDEIAAALHQSTLYTASLNLLLAHQVGVILQALQQAGIPAVVLKGLHLAELVYEGLQLRPIGDVDLLIQRRDLAAARQALADLGYRAERGGSTERLAQQHHHLPPLSKPGAHAVELHWTLSQPGGATIPEPAGIWQRSQPAVLAGQPALVLCPEDLLLHLALHFQSHNFRLSLRHLYDFVALFQRCGPQLDWEAVVTRSRQWRAEKCTFLSLYLAGDLLHLPLPPHLLDTLQPAGFTPQLADLARARLLDPPPSALHSDLAGMLDHKPLPRKLRAAANAAFPPKDYVRSRYNLPPGSPRVYPMYLLRLGQLLARYGGQVWGMLRRSPEIDAAAQRENALNDWLTAPALLPAAQKPGG